MSLLDSEEVIAHDTEMEFDITHEYLIDVMGYDWVGEPNWNMDFYKKNFIGNSWIRIRKYRNSEVTPWFAEYSIFGAAKHTTTLYKIKDIYGIYKMIRESYLKIGRE
mgnify:CR=1 FL=1